MKFQMVADFDFEAESFDDAFVRLAAYFLSMATDKDSRMVLRGDVSIAPAANATGASGGTPL